MCKIGDIIAVPSMIGETGMMVKFHYFVVISSDKGTIAGFDFDMVGSMMCSSEGKKKDYMRRKLSYKENLEIQEIEFDLENKNKP